MLLAMTSSPCDVIANAFTLQRSNFVMQQFQFRVTLGDLSVGKKRADRHAVSWQAITTHRYGKINTPVLRSSKPLESGNRRLYAW